ncbi:MAG: hypothetical protein H0U12_00760 [Thermoleophilaceae bacterium]|nr:hypothetical protein [Thermoleophilaceae bacterium]
MLFDLKGKRRRVVQATYLTLAVLMGGGLVFLGIGSDTQGGLLDAFTGGSDSDSSNNPIVERRLESAQERLRANPNDQAALAELTRARFQLAGDDADPNTGLYGPKARPDLRAAAATWERYLGTDPQPPDPSLARVMLQVYGEFGLNQPGKAAQAADIVAQEDESSSALLTLARYASLAKQERKAALAGRRAIALASDSQRKVVKQQVEAIKAQSAAQAAGGGGAGAAPGAGGGAGGAGGALPGAGGSPGGAGR